MIIDNKDKTFDLSFRIHNRMSVGRTGPHFSATAPGVMVSGKHRQNQSCKVLERHASTSCYLGGKFLL